MVAQILPTLAERKLIRRLAGVSDRTPIYVDDDSRAPGVEGRSYHWLTLCTCSASRTCRYGGQDQHPEVYHPSAYGRRYGRTYYVASTRRLTVGAGWILALRSPASLAPLADLSEIQVAA